MNGHENEVAPAPKKDNTTRTVIIVLSILLLGGVLMMGVVAAMVVPAMSRTREVAKRVASASNLAQIGKALILYADAEGKGKGPADPAKLLPNYIEDARVFKRPGYPESQDVHYMLVVGVAQEDSSDTIAAFENPPPELQSAGRNVLYAAGNVQWESDSTFQASLKKSEAKFKSENRVFKVVPISRSALKK